jgi:Tfp pilus assembly protein PilO
MKALYTQGASVPWRRVLREHRAALLPLGVVLAINIIALVAVVLPLSQRAATIEERAATAERTRAAAEADFKRTDAARLSSSRATEDLATFYRDVLPSNVAAARRIFQLRLRQLADSHGVQYQGSGTTEEQLKDSNLLRLMMSMQLAGSYGDIRGFIHDLETSPDFVVIEQIRLSEGARGEEALELNLDVSTYYRNAQAAVQTGNNGR